MLLRRIQELSRARSRHARPESAGATAWLRRWGIASALVAGMVGSSAVAEQAIQAAPDDNEAPTAVIAMSHPDGPLTVGVPLTLDGTGSTDPDGDPLTYEWYIFTGPSDNLVSTDATYVHRFAESGSYDIALVVTDSSGAQSRANANVSVTSDNTRPVAAFDYSPKDLITTAMIVTFDASSSSDPDGDELTYEWWTGPSGSQTLLGDSQELQHTFTTPGPTEMRLVVTDSVGATTELSKPITIVSDNPVAAITQSPRSPVVLGAPVTFDGSGSIDPLGRALTYQWRVAGQDEVIGDAPTLEYTFSTAGTVDVELTVTNTIGETGSATQSVTVNTRPIANYTRSPSASVLKVGTTLKFDASGSSDPDGDAITYKWRVRGDDNIGDGETFEYTFAKAGKFGVQLAVTDERGAVSTKWEEVTIVESFDPPVARWSQSPNAPTVAPGTEVTFDGSASTGESLTYEWRVRGEKGIVTNEKVLKYTFKNNGAYGVELIVTDATGRSAKKWFELKVLTTADPPVATFTQSPSSPTVTPGTEVTFDGSASTGDQLTYAWKVRGEEGVYSTDKVLKYKFKDAGSYGIQLTVTDSIGRQSQKWVGLEAAKPINKVPVADFTRSPDSSPLAANTLVTFDASPSSDPDGDQLTYYWFVRGELGVVGNSKVFKWRFTTPGDYAVELMVVDPSNGWSKKRVEFTIAS